MLSDTFAKRIDQGTDEGTYKERGGEGVADDTEPKAGYSGIIGNQGGGIYVTTACWRGKPGERPGKNEEDGPEERG